MYRLIIINGPAKGKRLVIHQDSVAIGRNPQCGVQLHDDEVSWKHAMIEQREDGIYIRDLGSLNKITIGGNDVREAKLTEGVSIELGRTKMRFETIEKYAPTTTRRMSLLQGITLLTVVAVLILEALFLLGLSFWEDGGLRHPTEICEANVETEPTEKAVITNEESKVEATQTKNTSAETSPPPAEDTALPKTGRPIEPAPETVSPEQPAQKTEVPAVPAPEIEPPAIEKSSPHTGTEKVFAGAG